MHKLLIIKLISATSTKNEQYSITNLSRKISRILYEILWEFIDTVRIKSGTIISHWIGTCTLHYVYILWNYRCAYGRRTWFLPLTLCRRHNTQAVCDLERCLSACVDDLWCWMQSNRLQMNASKTELLWCTTARRQHQLSRAATAIGTGFIVSSSTVHDLNIFIDADLSVRTHVQRAVAGCFAVLRQLYSIRRSVPFTVFRLWLLHSCCLNLTTAMLHWLLHRPVNFAIFSMPLLGWLPVFDDLSTSQTRLPVFTGSELRSESSLNWLSSSIPPYPWYGTSIPVWTTSPRRRHSTTKALSDVYFRRFFLPSSRLVSVGDWSFAVAAPKLWTLYPTTSRLHHLFLFFTINWRHFCFRSLILTLFCT